MKQKKSFHPEKVTYTTAGCYCDLYGVAPRLTHLLQVQGLVRGFVVTPFDAQRSCIDTNLIVGKSGPGLGQVTILFV